MQEQHITLLPSAEDAARGDPPSPAYAMIPPDARRGVVVIHEIFGPQPEIQRVVQRLALAGYAAVAPDLFHAGRLRCVWSVMKAIHLPEKWACGDGELASIRQARRARAYLEEVAGVPAERVGIIGFCFGGGFALLCGSGWGAVSTNYGDIPRTERMRGIGPVIGCYGGRDRLFGRKGERLERRLQPLGVAPEVHTFTEVGHSFLTDGHHPIAELLSGGLLGVGNNPEVREEGWERILGFFDRHLGPR